MALSVDPKALATAAGLKHYKEFFTALNTPATGQTDAVKSFRTLFNSLNLQDSEEKEWVLTVTSFLAFAKDKSASDGLSRAVALRRELSNPLLARVREVVTALGANAIDWVKEFGTNLNLVDLRKITAVLGRDNARWTQSIPSARKKADVIGKTLSALIDSGFKKDEVIALWNDFANIGGETVWSIAEEMPIQLYAAHRHLKQLGTAADFWMKESTQKTKDAIKPVIAIVYNGDTWSEKPTEVNAMAKMLTGATGAAWIGLFTIAQLLDIQARLAAITNPGFFPAAGRLAAAHNLREDTAFGKWLADYCDLIVKLIRNGFHDVAIIEMFRNNFNRKLIVQSTWFSRTALPKDADTEIMFRVDNVHGVVIGRRNHLAQRHLYAHFDFTDIKTLNSFHPPETTVQQMVKMTDGMKLPDRNSGAKLIKGYYVVVGEHGNVEKRLVISLYPNLHSNHQDQFTKDELDRVKNVVKCFPPGLVKLTH